MIEPIEEEPEVEVSDSDHEEVEINDDVEAVTHIVHVLAGYSNPQTMKIGGTLKHQSVTILIDTCSTNNFTDRKVVARLAYHIECCDKFEVKVADGWILTCDKSTQR